MKSVDQSLRPQLQRAFDHTRRTIVQPVVSTIQEPLAGSQVQPADLVHPAEGLHAQQAVHNNAVTQATPDAEGVAKYLLTMSETDRRHLLLNHSPFGFLMRLNPLSMFGVGQEAPSPQFKAVSQALESQLQQLISNIQSAETKQALENLFEQVSQGAQLQANDPLQEAALKSLEANAEMIKASSLMHVLEVAEKKVELVGDAQSYLLATQPKQVIFNQLKGTQAWQSALGSLNGIETILTNLNLMVANAYVPKEVSGLFAEFGALHDGFSSKAAGLFERFSQLMQGQQSPGSRFLSTAMSQASVNGQPVHQEVKVQADPATQKALAPELQALQQTQVAPAPVQQTRMAVTPQVRAQNPLANVFAQTQGQNALLN